MLSKITAGYIIFEFEQSDWKRDWKGFLVDLKKTIPSNQRKYDSETKIWSIVASKENQMHFDALKKLYFGADPNQEVMF